jgi:tetratricopeptide (TPR) repeat protein
VNNYFKKLEIPSKLYQDEWKNFGHNRSNSFLNALYFCKKLNWDLNKTYGLLLDADMNLVIKNFNKDELTMNGYNIIQENPCIEYYNTRFLRMSFSWRCVGVTHEYWNGENIGTLSKDKIYINDIGDGGCKSDKISRDIKLLEDGLQEDPNNDRYHFYLAQSYKDKGDLYKAIELYKKRIKLNGWYEEVWYSHYMISKCYLQLKNEEKFEEWSMKAYNYRKCRAEPIYELVKYFRNNNQHYKAYHYYLIGKNQLA